MQPKRKIPLRMCLGCGEMKPKKELIRAVKNAEGEISIDFKGKKPGRGAYICPNVECFKKARKTKRFERAFESRIDDTIYDAMENQILNDKTEE